MGTDGVWKSAGGDVWSPNLVCEEEGRRILAIGQTRRAPVGTTSLMGEGEGGRSMGEREGQCLDALECKVCGRGIEQGLCTTAAHVHWQTMTDRAPAILPPPPPFSTRMTLLPLPCAPRHRA